MAKGNENKGGWSRICEKLETGAINRIKGLPVPLARFPEKAVSEKRLEPSALLFISQEPAPTLCGTYFNCLQRGQAIRSGVF